MTTELLEQKWVEAWASIGAASRGIQGGVWGRGGREGGGAGGVELQRGGENRGTIKASGARRRAALLSFAVRMTSPAYIN